MTDSLQDQKLDQILITCSKLDERSMNTRKDLKNISDHLKELNSKTAANTTDIALIKQRWTAIVIAISILVPVGMKFFI